MKLSFIPMALSLAIVMQPAQADLTSDSEQIMNDAEKAFTAFFPSKQATQVVDPFRFRFYPSSGIYLGINQNDAGVYLLGGSFGNTPFYVDQTDSVIALLISQLDNINNGKNAVCNTEDIPSSLEYRQEGDTTHITTNGQCVVLPENRSPCDIAAEKDSNDQPVATGVHVLSQTSVANFEVRGIEIPGFDSLIEQTATQTTCVIHAPAELTNHTVHLDICVDITNQLDDFGSLPGINPPVTTLFTGTATINKVDDCFNTDAGSITNVVTDEIWLNQNGTFIKSN